jgi:hypothetical protein
MSDPNALARLALDDFLYGNHREAQETLSNMHSDQLRKLAIEAANLSVAAQITLSERASE